VTGAVEVLNLVVTVSLVPAIVAVARRPARRWRTGPAGKAVSLVAVLFVNFHVGVVLVPFGAVVALARHRHDPEDRSPVPLADSWPGG
jgi:hypothetical protein